MDKKDIELIEKYLNNYTAERDIVFGQILNLTVMNQAMLESVLDNQAMMMKILDPDIDVTEFRKETKERADHYLVQIQAILSSKY